MKAFKNKIVLTYESSFSFACEAKRAGALGVLTILSRFAQNVTELRAKRN